MRKLLLIILIVLLAPLPAFADGDFEKGRAIYGRLCRWCHGQEGAGDGPAAEYLNPPPRDFTLGLYKWKSTPYDEMMPTENDYYRMIAGPRSHDSIPGWSGLNGTSMPGWADVLDDGEIGAVAAYIKSLAGMETPQAPAVVAKLPDTPSKERLERGRKLFLDRCAECHGREGKGDGEKRLKDDWGERTWPRNLTKGWTFRAGSGAGAIYERLTAGIPGTQMPSFADPVSKKMLTDEERIDVALYAASLDEPRKKPGAETVIKAARTDGAIPGPGDNGWESTERTNLYLFPQIIAGEKHYKPTLDSLTIRAMYNEKEMAIYLEWDDPTMSVPGDKLAEDIAGGEVFPDRVAVEFPAGYEKGEKPPYFGMGGKGGEVDIWAWQGPVGVGGKEGVRLLDARGPGDIRQKDATASGLSATGYYRDGAWRVVFRRPLETKDKKGIRFEDGVFTPVAFAAWDGSNGEKGSRHVMTGWASIRLAPRERGSIFIWPVVIAVIVFGAEMLWLKSAGRG